LVSGRAHGHAVTTMLFGPHSTEPGVARAVYKSLHRLQRHGFVVAEWRTEGDGSCAPKDYRLTRPGRRGGSERESTVRDARLVAAVLALVVAHVAEGVAADGYPLHRRIAVVVQSPDGGISYELRRARVEIERILGAIGIEIDWSIAAFAG